MTITSALGFADAAPWRHVRSSVPPELTNIALGFADAAPWRHVRSSVPPELTNIALGFADAAPWRHVRSSVPPELTNIALGSYSSTLPVEIRGNRRARSPPAHSPLAGGAHIRGGAKLLERRRPLVSL